MKMLGSGQLHLKKSLSNTTVVAGCGDGILFLNMLLQSWI